MKMLTLILLTVLSFGAFAQTTTDTTKLKVPIMVQARLQELETRLQETTRILNAERELVYRIFLESNGVDPRTIDNDSLSLSIRINEVLLIRRKVRTNPTKK